MMQELDIVRWEASLSPAADVEALFRVENNSVGKRCCKMISAELRQVFLRGLK